MTTTTIHRADERIVPEWELCDRLRRSLRLVNVDNQQMADFMGVRRETVSRWISGHNRPSGAVLRLWADMTGVDLDWLETGQAQTSVTSGPVAALPRLDSNQQPSGYRLRRLLSRWLRRSRVRPGLTVNRLPGNPRTLPAPMPEPSRPSHLRSVA